MDSIWRARNHLIHHHILPIESIITARADKLSLEHSEAQMVCSIQAKQQSLTSIWSPPPKDWFSSGDVLFAAARNFFAHNATQAEVEGLNDAAIWADILQIPRCLFESDSEGTVKMALCFLDSADWHSKVLVRPYTIFFKSGLNGLSSLLVAKLVRLPMLWRSGLFTRIGTTLFVSRI
ncbi:hypothetical protein BUALT_Bualt14G0115800 [Buddleja alternifolia]|uniref:Uncharacterized protein n=1 Tax=Buddleja alternifolia TaxID=168488 RepID=A0AAV6WJS7_9LAMI|nr:hypothetical protein BUALT_Bualt14G0115800 [Buddleja alternifolia]